MKRPILAVGLNLTVTCNLSLCSLVLFVSGFLPWRSCCVDLWTFGVLRPEVKACINASREGRSQKKVSLPSLIQSCVMNGLRRPFTAPSCSSCTSPLFCSTLIQLKSVTLETGANNPSHGYAFNPSHSTSPTCCLFTPLLLPPPLHCNRLFR